MSLEIGNVSLHMGPNYDIDEHKQGNDDLKNTIVSFISDAKKTLDIAVQELDSEDIAQAIVKAKQKGVKVRLVLEGDYLTEKRARSEPFEAGGSNEFNRFLHDSILRAKINVHSDYNPSIFHQKFVIKDKESVLTGSTNFTVTGTSKNLNHIVIIKDKKVAKIYTNEFKEIMQGHFGKINEGHDERPTEVEVSKIPIKVLFAPDHNPEMEIMKQMLKGKGNINFAIFTFSESSGIDDTMTAIARGGRKIRGAIDGKVVNQRWAANHKLLEQENIKLWKVPNRGRIGKLHHKLMVIDEQVIIAGSFNYTGPANMTNDENIIVLGDLDAEDDESIENQKKLAKFALTEIDRIINDYGIELK